MSVDEQILRGWAEAFIDFALHREYCESPVIIEDEDYQALLALYRAGMQPDEAAEAFYATRH